MSTDRAHDAALEPLGQMASELDDLVPELRCACSGLRELRELLG